MFDYEGGLIGFMKDFIKLIDLSIVCIMFRVLLLMLDDRFINMLYRELEIYLVMMIYVSIKL